MSQALIKSQLQL